ncbi:hypothetical protein D3C87_1630130 [compost metagenome]
MRIELSSGLLMTMARAVWPIICSARATMGSSAGMASAVPVRTGLSSPVNSARYSRVASMPAP